MSSRIPERITLATLQKASQALYRTLESWSLFSPTGIPKQVNHSEPQSSTNSWPIAHEVKRLQVSCEVPSLADKFHMVGCCILLCCHFVDFNSNCQSTSGTSQASTAINKRPARSLWGPVQILLLLLAMSIASTKVMTPKSDWFPV